MSTLPLQSAVVAAQFTKDGNKVVVILRDWSILMLTPGSPVWSKTVIPFKKETHPAENLILTLSPAEPHPVIYFAAAGTMKLNVVNTSLPTSKGSLLSSSQRPFFSTKLANSSIMSLATHPEEDDILIVLFSDGSIQGFALEQGVMKKLFVFGGTLSRSGAQGGTYLGVEGTGHGHGVQLEVVAHPFISGAALILAAAGEQLSIYAVIDRTAIEAVDALPLRNFKRINGIGIHKEARVILAFGELADGKLTCAGARFSGSKTSGMLPLERKTGAGEPWCIGVSLVPVNVTFSDAAMDVMVPNHSVSGITSVSDRGDGCSWMELWDAVPAWAQSTAYTTTDRQRIRAVRMHSVMGAIAAQSVMTGSGPHVLLWSISDAAHPLGGSHIGQVVPQHTPLSLWAGQTSSNPYKLEFPHHCYYASGNKLMGYGLRSKNVTELAAFHPPSGTSGPATAETIVYSKWHRAWLLFFRSFSTGPDHTLGMEEWTYTILREDEVGASPPWFKSGVSGVFIGPKDDHCTILDPDLFTVHVFPTKTVSSKDGPLLSLSLPSPGLLTPALFQGPPITQIPKPPPPPEFTESGLLADAVPEEEPDKKLGYGVIIWVNRFRQIAMGSMMIESNSRRTFHESETVEFVQGGTFSELSEGEIMIQVAWQTLSEAKEAYRAPNSFTAAVLTNQRLMIFLANGYPVLSFPPQNSPGLTSPPTSCLWAGPALLYVTRTGEVHQLLWDGTTVMICGAPSTTGGAVLAAALADRILFLCREPESQSWQMATRYAIMGYALLMGWASLASSGLMPPAWLHAHARSQMKIVLQHFDSSTISVPVARTLVQSDFADVACIVANRWPKEAQAIKVACSVAARRWKEAAEGLMHEYHTSVYHPNPIPRGTTMWKRFYSVAMGAVRHNQAEIGAELFATAGEWEWSLIFYSTSSNTSKIAAVLNNAAQQLTPAEHQNLTSLSQQLRKRSVAYSELGLTSTDSADELDETASWMFAATGYLAPMYSTQGETPNGMIKDGDVGLVAPLETTDIKGYISGASKQAARGSFLNTVATTISGKNFAPKPSTTDHPSIPESLEVGESFSSPASMQRSTTQRHRHGFSDIVFDETFSSDDGDGDEIDGEAMGQETKRSSGSFTKKFSIQIRKKEDHQTVASSDALREAAKNLRLGGLGVGPSLGPGGFAAAMKGGSGMVRVESASSMSSEQSHLDPKGSITHRSESVSDVVVSKPLSTSPHDPFTSTTASGSFDTGIKEMEGGNWDAAIEAFSRQGVLTVPCGKQYLAAVLLLKKRAPLTGVEAARLDRFAASLEIEDRHKKRISMQAVQENIQIGNYGYAQTCLHWLMESSKGQLAQAVVASMEKQLDECKRHKGANGNISPFENLTAISHRIEAAATVDELVTIVNNLA